MNTFTCKACGKKSYSARTDVSGACIYCGKGPLIMTEGVKEDNKEEQAK